MASRDYLLLTSGTTTMSLYIHIHVVWCAFAGARARHEPNFYKEASEGPG